MEGWPGVGWGVFPPPPRAFFSPPLSFALFSPPIEGDGGKRLPLAGLYLSYFQL
jgi:hypothetical protein